MIRMKVVKMYPPDGRGKHVSEIFDDMLRTSGCNLTFDRIEFHLRDTNMSKVSGSDALVCMDYNSPAIQENDQRAIRTQVLHELFRLMFKFDLPRVIDDVIIGREMVKRGFGDDLFYLYYVIMMRTDANNLEGYIRVNLPWIIFSGYDNYNSNFMKKLSSKLAGRKYPEVKRLLDILSGLSQNNLATAVEEYNKLVGDHAHN